MENIIDYSKSHDVLRKEVTWGTFGKTGRDPLKFVALEDMSDEHIKAILRTQRQIITERRALYMTELALREHGVYPSVEETK